MAWLQPSPSLEDVNWWRPRYALPHGLHWPWPKFGEVATISGAWWEVACRWVLQVLLSEVLTIGILRRGLASALFASEHN